MKTFVFNAVVCSNAAKSNKKNENNDGSTNLVDVSRLNPSWQLSITQPLAHSLPCLAGWAGELGAK